MKYRPEIDGLRAVAVIPVILFHAGFSVFSGGFVGVDIFFVISGFLITTIILSEKDGENFSIIKFYERRARRILPALFLIMALSIPAAALLLTPHDLQSFSKSLVSVSFFVSNFQFWRESGYFDSASELKPLLHTWSLAVEEQYYIFFPLFICLAWRMGKKWLLAFLLMGGVLSLGVAQWGAYNKPYAAFYLLPTRFWELLVGALIAFYFNMAPNRKSSKARDQILSLTGAAMITLSVFIFDKTTPFPGVAALLPTLGAALIIMFANHGTLLYSLLSHKKLVGIGLISYSAYLWHQPIFAFARYQNFDHLPAITMLGLSLLSLGLAYLSWRFVENPFRQKGRFSRRFIFTASALGMLVFSAIGAYGTLHNGKIFTISPERLARAQTLEQQGIDRGNAINGGLCHFNRRGQYQNIDQFLNNWNCKNNDEADLRSTNMLVFGDSHSADKLNAIKAAGYDVAQIGGAGCPLLNENLLGRRKFCTRLFALAKQQGDIQTILLSNRFDREELTKQHLRKVTQYWSNQARDVLIFSPMPSYDHLKREYVATGQVQSLPSLEAHNKFFEIIGQIELPDNVKIINTVEILCGEEQECKAMHNGVLLFADKDHLSNNGAKYFGDRLLKATAFQGALR